MIYLDSSAVVKTIWLEPEPGPLLAFLRRQLVGVPRFASSLLVTEVLRAVARHAEQQDLPATDASAYRSGALNQVNALHLVEVEDLTSFVTYDQRLADAATTAGLPVDAPSPRDQGR